MPASKVAKSVLKSPQGKKFLAGVGASIVDEVLDNPVVSAAEGAVLGFAVGGPIGAAGGGIAGWYLADATTVVPVDMIAIPAYQAYMLQGSPAFQIFIRAGETIVATGGNVQDVQEVVQETMPGKKKVKMSKWNRYVKNKKNHIRFKSGKNKGKLDLKKMAKAGGFGKKGGRK